MPQLFSQLRERLLRFGIAPRHVRRYLKELAEHLDDLRAEEQRAGRSRRDTEAAALARLGSVDDLANAMVQQPQLRSWSARAPWLTFGFAPLCALGIAYFIACFILWSGWKIFLPGAETPFGTHEAAIYSLENIYFQVGRMLYFSAPVFVGWGIGIVTARQRLNVVWPAVGLFLTALIGVSARVHAIRPGPGAGGHVSMDFSLGEYGPGLLHFLFFLSLMALPYLVWRLYRAFVLA